MSLNPMTHQEFCDARVARYATPDDCPIQAGEHAYVLNRPMRCPICGRTFYAYQRVDAPEPPYQTDPQPDWSHGAPVVGARRTCNHPNCEAAEEREQFRRRLEAEGHHHPDGLEPAKVAPARPRTRLKRAGEMG